MMIRAHRGYSSDYCEFGMQDGEALGKYIEILMKFAPREEKDLEIRLKRVLEDEEPVNKPLEGVEISE